MEETALLALLLGGALIYLLWDTYIMGEVEYVESTVDNRKYLVQSLPDKQDAANMLAKIREKLIRLRDHLEKTEPDDPRTLRFVKNFRPDNLSEGTDRAKYTSYSVNKGERIIFCVRGRDEENKLVDENTMMFVAIHELGHIVTKSTGHTPEFWDNFKWLLEEAINIGIYSKADYRKKPQPYCGIMITDSPVG